jgi:hypothetical protein
MVTLSWVPFVGLLLLALLGVLSLVIVLGTVCFLRRNSLLG